MADLDDAITDLKAATLESMGYPVTYVSKAGAPVDAVCFASKANVDQPAVPGYFGVWEFDTALIPTPRQGDGVVWADGTRYVVQKVSQPLRGFVTLTLHRKQDR